MPSALIILALLVAGGVGVSAEQSTPNDILYPIKVNINENVRSGLQFSDDAEASWDAKLVARRISEAEKLSLESNLSSDLSAELTERIEANIKSYEENIDDLETDDKYQEVADISAQFESTLNSHIEVLKGLSLQAEGETKTSLNNLVAVLEKNSDKIAASRINAEAEARANIEGQTEAEAKANLNGQITRTEKQIRNATSFIERRGSEVEAGVRARAEANLEKAEESLLKAQTEIEANAYGVAQDLLSEARRLSQSAKTSIITYGKFDLSLNKETENETRTDEENMATTTETESGTASTSVEINSQTETNTKSDDTTTDSNTKSETGVNISL